MREAKPQAPAHDDIRCHCGQLVARWAEGGIQIKCKRCRRVVSIPFTAIHGSRPTLPVEGTRR